MHSNVDATAGLAEIKTDAIQAFIAEHVANSGVAKIWIGCLRQPNGNYEWGDGTACGKTDSAYQNWVPSQPDDDAACVNIYTEHVDIRVESQWGWADQHCTTALNFVCQTTQSPTTTRGSGKVRAVRAGYEVESNGKIYGLLSGHKHTCGGGGTMIAREIMKRCQQAASSRRIHQTFVQSLAGTIGAPSSLL